MIKETPVEEALTEESLTEEIFRYLDYLKTQGVNGYYHLFLEPEFGLAKEVSEKLVEKWLETRPEKPYSEDILNDTQPNT